MWRSDNNKKNGMTFVELLIVVSILAVLAIIMVAVINPISQTNKGSDARRKKDLNRIKVAFEEYYNDKGCYPGIEESQYSVAEMMDQDNCGKSFFSPWLAAWPCDPSGKPYFFVAEESDCPKWFKVMTGLQNQSDSDIPEGIKEDPENFLTTIQTVTYNGKQINYGVSSPNISWLVLDCGTPGNCYRKDGATGDCQSTGTNSCSGPNCYTNKDCDSWCRVERCNM